MKTFPSQRFGWVQLLGAALLLSACASQNPDDAVSDQIVDGSPSPKADDGVVFVEPGCTGTLIAPNLVLTAAHCVVRQDVLSNFACGNFAADAVIENRSLRENEYAVPRYVRYGRKAAKLSAAEGKTRVAQVLLPEFQVANNAIDLCERDVALLVLQERAKFDDGTDVPLVPVSFAVPRAEQSVRIVGYGIAVDSEGELIPEHPRLQAQRTFASVIDQYPTAETWPKGPEYGLSYDLGRTDLVSFEASGLWGDSGGPILLSIGGVRHVVGVNSRLIQQGSTLEFALPWRELLERRNLRAVPVNLGQFGQEGNIAYVVGLINNAVFHLRSFVEEGKRLAAAYLVDPKPLPELVCGFNSPYTVELTQGVCSNELKTCLDAAGTEQTMRDACFMQHDVDGTCTTCLTNRLYTCAINEGGDASCGKTYGCYVECVVENGCTAESCVPALVGEGGACKSVRDAFDACVLPATAIGTGRCDAARAPCFQTGE